MEKFSEYVAECSVENSQKSSLEKMLMCEVMYGVSYENPVIESWYIQGGCPKCKSQNFYEMKKTEKNPESRTKCRDCKHIF